jgi:MarR-like DNA-binding transcriptional regulator SgrR of sgrS sRNA
MVESNSQNFKKDLEAIKNVFNTFKEYSQKELNAIIHEERIIELNQKLGALPYQVNKNNKQNVKLQVPQTHFGGHNMWFLK